MTFPAAVPGPDGQPLDQIRLAGVSATGHHGVLDHERAEGQVFSADVVLHLDTRAAASSDDLERTVSYADVAQDVHDVLAGSPADLVETVAERIAAVVLARPAVQAVDVRVHKPQAPIPVPFDDVEVVVRRDRSHPPVVPASVEQAPEQVPVQEPVVEAPAVAEAVAVPPAPAPLPEPVAPTPPADPLDATPAEPEEAVLALGANLGDAQVTLRQAVTDIDRLPGVQVMEVSPLARTAAVGGPEQSDYLNAVLVVRTTLSPRDLLRATQQVEGQHGRVREERWGPRTLDVDIVQYGALVASAPDLELPHPRAKERAFVLVPWAEVAPDAQLGGQGGGPVGQLAVTAPDRSGIRWLALDWLTGPTQSTGQISTASADPAPSTPVPQSPAAAEGQSPAAGYGAEPYPAEPPADEPPAHQPSVVAPLPAEPRREDPPAPGPQAAAHAPFGDVTSAMDSAMDSEMDADQPVMPRPFAPAAPVVGESSGAFHSVHAPVPSAPVPSAPAPSAPVPPAGPAASSFAPTPAPLMQSVPEAFVLPAEALEAYTPEAFTPEAYTPEAYTPEAYPSESYAPPAPARHEPVPPAPGAPQERYGEDDR